jgi:hypothetical protein
MYDVLKAPDRLKHEVKGVSGVLAYLWRSILEQRNIGLGKFDNLCMTYIAKARRQQASAKIANYFNRSNIFREMSRPMMTWKVFVKGMQLIGIIRMKITIELEGRDGTTVHTTSLTLSGEDGVSYADTLENADDHDAPVPAPPAAAAPQAASASDDLEGTPALYNVSPYIEPDKDV